MSSTDTSERGLERLICTALAGEPCDPPKAAVASSPPGLAASVSARRNRPTLVRIMVSPSTTQSHRGAKRTGGNVRGIAPPHGE